MDKEKEDKCAKGKCGYGESCEYCQKILEGWLKEWNAERRG